MLLHIHHRATDINPRYSLHQDALCKYGILHSPIADCRKCASRVIRMGNRVHLLESVFLQSFLLNNKRPVQVFTTLTGQKSSPVYKNRSNSIVDSLCHFEIGSCSNSVTKHFAG